MCCMVYLFEGNRNDEGNVDDSNTIKILNKSRIIYFEQTFGRWHQAVVFFG